MVEINVPEGAPIMKTKTKTKTKTRGSRPTTFAVEIGAYSYAEVNDGYLFEVRIIPVSGPVTPAVRRKVVETLAKFDTFTLVGVDSARQALACYITPDRITELLVLAATFVKQGRTVRCVGNLFTVAAWALER